MSPLPHFFLGRESVLAFRVGATHYGVPFTRVGEVRTLQNAKPLFHGPTFETGLVVFHGRTLPLLDLRRVAGVAAGFTLETRVMVAWIPHPEVGDAGVALVVDQVNALFDVDPNEVDGMGGDAETAALPVLGRVSRQGCRHLLLDLDGLFSG